MLIVQSPQCYMPLQDCQGRPLNRCASTSFAPARALCRLPAHNRASCASTEEHLVIALKISLKGSLMVCGLPDRV